MFFGTFYQYLELTDQIAHPAFIVNYAFMSLLEIKEYISFCCVFLKQQFGDNFDKFGENINRILINKKNLL